MRSEEKILLGLFCAKNEKKIAAIDGMENESDDKDDELIEDESPINAEFIDLSHYTEHLNTLMDPHIIKSIYDDILDGQYFTSSLDLQDILKCLCSYYIVSYEESNNYTYNFIKEHDLRFLYSFFKTNEAFAVTLIYNYYLSKFYNIDIDNFSQEHELYNRFSIDRRVRFISDYVRELYEDAITTMMEYGASTEDVIKIMYLSLIGKTIVTGNDEICDKIEEVAKYRNILIKLIHSDLYEDMLAYESDDEEFKLIKEQILYNINNNFYVLPKSELGLKIVERFTDLVYDPATREYNRNQLNNDQIKTLKKVNPWYSLERVMIGYENK